MLNTLLIRSVLCVVLCPLTGVTMAQNPTHQDLGGQVEAIVAGQVRQFPLLESHYKVTIKGDLATVQLTQVFTNPLSEPVNARYLFPLNRNAAVYDMTMNVGDEVIRAVIKEKDEAQKTFIKAKAQGKSAVLTEQHRPNMFTQKLANLTPGYPITVDLSYTHAVTRIDGAYQLELPLVVGPRYQPVRATQFKTSDEPPTVSKVGQWELETLPTYPPTHGVDLPPSIDPNRISLTVELDAGINIQRVISTTHEIDTVHVDSTYWTVSLAEDRIIANRDFVLRYSLAGDATQVAMLHHSDERGGFFSLLIEPPAVTPIKSVTPREMVFVLDCSGSMSGLPMETSKMFMRKALGNLRPTDTFRIIRFSDFATEFSQTPLPATTANIQAGIAYTNQLHGTGGTEMSAGIRQALQAPPADGTLRVVTFLTDGYIGNEATILSLIDTHLNDARLFALGVGTATNRFLLDEMARVGRGFVRYMDPTENAESVASDLAERLQTPVLTNITVDFGDLQVTDVYPTKIPDLFEGDSIRVQGRYSEAGSHTINVRGQVNGQAATLPVSVSLNAVDSNGDAVALIWARSAIADTMRMMSRTQVRPAHEPESGQELQERLKQEVIDLGLTFSLATRWTSFVAVSEKIYNANPATTPTLDVPLEKVKGVSAKAYPSTASPASAMQFVGNSAPEPHVNLLLLMIGLFGSSVWVIRRVRQNC